MFNDKVLKSVADAVNQVMAEALKGNQHKIDKNKNNKIDAQDFKLLRKEETVTEEEKKKSPFDWKNTPRETREKGELTGHESKKTSTGTVYTKKPVKEEAKSDPCWKGYEMVGMKDKNGRKVPNCVPVKEESSQEEFNKEIKKAQAKSEGKEKADVAKPAVQAVQQEATHTEVQVVDMTDPDNIVKKTIDLEERHLTPGEMEKREKNVKGMKKSLQGFKERYGSRAKEVMYATATKQAKGE